MSELTSAQKTEFKEFVAYLCEEAAKEIPTLRPGS